MEIFGVGPAELVLILVVVLIIFGPEQLPEIAKKLGGATRELRRNLDAVNNEVNENLRSFKEVTDLTKLAPPESPPPSSSSGAAETPPESTATQPSAALPPPNPSDAAETPTESTTPSAAAPGGASDESPES
jgi:sec-independent protein translocase protein TatA